MALKTPAGYEFLDHTADVGILAWGPDLREVFAQAARAMFDLIVDPETVQERVARPIQVSADDREALLVAWLNELLFPLDAENLLFRRFEIERLTDRELVATAYGERLDRSRHRQGTAVKAATYHQLELHEGSPAWARVILDI